MLLYNINILLILGHKKNYKCFNIIKIFYFDNMSYVNVLNVFLQGKLIINTIRIKLLEVLVVFMFILIYSCTVRYLYIY